LKHAYAGAALARELNEILDAHAFAALDVVVDVSSSFLAG
jgi:hypothetical protein